jgi:hypothetical protein
VAVSHERNIGILLSLWRHDDQLLLIFVLSRCRSAGVGSLSDFRVEKWMRADVLQPERISWPHTSGEIYGTTI